MKIAIVTGAAQGIGRRTAEVLAEAGYALALIDVRPGATVKHGEVLATLDCRDASAAQLAVANEARAVEAKQRAQLSIVVAVQIGSERFETIRLGRCAGRRQRPLAPPRPCAAARDKLPRP